MVKKIIEPPKPYVWSKWPSWATNKDGHKRICLDPEDYERHTGIRVDEMGNPVEPEPEPEPLQTGAAYEHEKAVEEAAALGTTPEDLKDLRQMASAGEPLVKPRGKKSAAPVQSGELAKEGGW